MGPAAAQEPHLEEMEARAREISGTQSPGSRKESGGDNRRQVLRPLAHQQEPGALLRLSQSLL